MEKLIVMRDTGVHAGSWSCTGREASRTGFTGREALNTGYAGIEAGRVVTV